MDPNRRGEHTVRTFERPYGQQQHLPEGLPRVARPSLSLWTSSRGARHRSARRRCVARSRVARRAGWDGARTEGCAFAISRLQRHSDCRCLQKSHSLQLTTKNVRGVPTQGARVLRWKMNLDRGGLLGIVAQRSVKWRSRDQPRHRHGLCREVSLPPVSGLSFFLPSQRFCICFAPRTADTGKEVRNARLW